MKINGERPLVLAEIRLVRRRWSWGRRAGALGVGALVVALVLVDVRAALVGVAALVIVIDGLGRPCPACHRWLQHTLACDRGRP